MCDLLKCAVYTDCVEFALLLIYLLVSVLTIVSLIIVFMMYALELFLRYISPHCVHVRLIVTKISVNISSIFVMCNSHNRCRHMVAVVNSN